MRGYDDLRALAFDEVWAENTSLHFVALEADRELERCPGVEVPNLRGVDAVPASGSGAESANEITKKPASD